MRSRRSASPSRARTARPRWSAMYSCRPSATPSMPAVVMMHGRGGAYSKAAKGRFDASTISQRHRMWGNLWAANGYVAVLVDGFGPRGYPARLPALQLRHPARRGERSHGAPARRLWRGDLAAHAQGRRRRPHRIAGMVERRQCRARDDGSSSRPRRRRRRSRASTPRWCSIRPAGCAAASTTAIGRMRRCACFTAPPTRRRRHARCNALVEKQPQGRRRHRDHALSRRGARLRRSRPRTAEQSRQFESESGRDGARTDVSSRSNSRRKNPKSYFDAPCAGISPTTMRFAGLTSRILSEVRT